MYGCICAVIVMFGIEEISSSICSVADSVGETMSAPVCSSKVMRCLSNRAS